MTLPKAIICSLDGTLSDHRHRLHFVKKPFIDSIYGNLWIDGGPDWEAFYAAMDKDKVNEAVDLIASAAFWYNCSNDNDPDMIFITGRPERYRDQTEKWLAQPALKWAIEPEHGVKLFMRPDFLINCEGHFLASDAVKCPKCSDETPDHRPSHVVKKEIFEREIAGKYDILFALESCDDAIEMYRGLGITCLKVCLP